MASNNECERKIDCGYRNFLIWELHRWSNLTLSSECVWPRCRVSFFYLSLDSGNLILKQGIVEWIMFRKILLLWNWHINSINVSRWSKCIATYNCKGLVDFVCNITSSFVKDWLCSEGFILDSPYPDKWIETNPDDFMFTKIARAPIIHRQWLV
jgi:hypothetical protein